MSAMTFERGRFVYGPNGHPRFAGSSSGVYLADTVREELAEEGAGAEGIEEAFISRNNGPTERRIHSELYSQYLLRLKCFKEDEELRTYIQSYFANWHPLFPFLDGASLIAKFDEAVSVAKLTDMVTETLPGPSESTTAGAPGTNRHDFAFDTCSGDERLVTSAILRAVLSLGRLDRLASAAEQATSTTPIDSDNSPYFSRVQQAADMGHLILTAVQADSIHGIMAMQGLLAIQLYLYAVRQPRPAMHLGGTMTKLAYEHGLHRCPERYQQNFSSPAEREMRKRVFYSFYALDRLLSAEFGIPLTVNDSDIDTCVPGEEDRHTPEQASPDHPARSPAVTESKSVPGSSRQLGRGMDSPSSHERPAKRRRLSHMSDHLAHASPRPSASSPHPEKQKVDVPAVDAEVAAARRRLLPALAIVTMTRMLGKAMETFNKCLRHRVIDNEEVLILRADLDRWWNDLGIDYDEEEDASSGPAGPDPRRRFSTLFTCLYHQQIMNLNRPMLSVSPSKVQHAAALQSSISSARAICSTLAKALSGDGLAVFWPGYVDMVFFSGLILVYGARREQAGQAKARAMDGLRRDLRRIINILETCQQRWKGISTMSGIMKSFLSRVNGNGSHAEENQPIDPARGGQAVEQGAPMANIPRENLDDLQDFSQAAFPDPMFYFNFDTFELNPEEVWAYHFSIPGSPVRQ